MSMKINPIEKFTLFPDQWHPRIIAEMNDSCIKVVRIQGEFTWHHHEEEDELFYVLRGKMKMQFRDRIEDINTGELIVVPHGVEHCPLADDEAWVMLFEPRGTRNTGNVENERTVEADWI